MSAAGLVVSPNRNAESNMGRTSWREYVRAQSISVRSIVVTAMPDFVHEITRGAQIRRSLLDGRTVGEQEAAMTTVLS